jgi:hypothetical protein
MQGGFLVFSAAATNIIPHPGGSIKIRLSLQRRTKMIYEIVAIGAQGGESVATTATRPAKAKDKAIELATFLVQHGGRGPDGNEYRHVIVRAKGASFALQTVELDADALGLCGDPDCGHDHQH